jgi:hypothetical protein
VATATEAAELRQTHNGGAGRPQQWVVFVDGREIGLIERWKGGKTLPWHAYAGIGRKCRHLGMFYPLDRVFGDGSFLPATGGKDAAIAAVLAAHRD